jgi:hypothetical protein
MYSLVIQFSIRGIQRESILVLFLKQNFWKNIIQFYEVVYTDEDLKWHLYCLFPRRFTPV